MRWHIRLAKAAGIDAFLVAWWGPNNKDHPSFLRIDGKPVYYLYQVAYDPSLTPAKFAELKSMSGFSPHQEWLLSDEDWCFGCATDSRSLHM